MIWTVLKPAFVGTKYIEYTVFGAKFSCGLLLKLLGTFILRNNKEFDVFGRISNCLRCPSLNKDT